MTETLANGYSYESARRELSNEYQHDRAGMVFKCFSVLVLRMKVASALEGLVITTLNQFMLVANINRLTSLKLCSHPFFCHIVAKLWPDNCRWYRILEYLVKTFPWPKVTGNLFTCLGQFMNLGSDQRQQALRYDWRYLWPFVNQVRYLD